MKETEDLKNKLLREKYFHKYWHTVAIIFMSVTAGIIVSLIIVTIKMI